MPNYVDSKGRPIQLGPKIAQGGEGVVYSLSSSTKWVAKIYLSKPSAQRESKIRAMVSQRSDQLSNLTAWPVELLIERDKQEVQGFLMANAGSLKAVHQLYSPRSRATEFQSVDWRFLIQAGANIARAFASVHQAGHVIGDVNHSSVFVAQDATVKLIDCDSFQINQDGIFYPCEVGEPFHTPPELQGKKFSTVVRTTNHDNFGLAVLIFELLFMGRHPFAGGYLGAGDMSLEQKIEGFRFAYGPGAASRQMRPPPGTLDLAAVGPKVSTFFERAFGKEGLESDGRPRAEEWIKALSSLQANTIVCRSAREHAYWKELDSCPWCAIEAATGVTLFKIPFALRSGRPAFDVGLVWDQICKVPKPKEPSPITFVPAALPAPEERYRVGKAQRIRTLVVGGILALVAGVLASVAVGAAGSAIGVAVFGASFAFGKDAIAELKNQAQTELHSALQETRHLEKRWDALAKPGSFKAKFAELEGLWRQYRNLPETKKKRLQELQSSIRQRQLDRYLQACRIVPGAVPGIGRGRCRTLQSYGIESASDVEPRRIRMVDGFGPSLTSQLLSWRQGLESKFVFRPNVGVHPQDVQDLETEMFALQTQLENSLTEGPRQLERILRQIEYNQASLRQPIENAVQRAAQAHANSQHLARM